jgi:hypothetical protein
MNAWPIDHEVFPQLKEILDRPDLKLRTYPVLYWLAILVIVLGAIKLVKAVIYMLTSELVVTNQRVIGKQGWIRRRSIDIRHRRFESFETDDQSLFGRILGYGTITAHGSGGTAFTLKTVFYPFAYRDEANSIFALCERKPTPPRHPVSDRSAAVIGSEKIQHVEQGVNKQPAASQSRGGHVDAR